MPKYIKSDWIPEFWQNRSFFLPVSLFADILSSYKTSWPTLHDMQGLLDTAPHDIRTKSDLILRVVEQAEKPVCFEEHYAPRIYLTGEMQTRTENWHDFFQVISWMLFPKSKAIINERHFHAAQERHKSGHGAQNRSTLENLFSLFDECGAVVLSSNKALLDGISNHDWKTIFYDQRSTLAQRLDCFIFGHAMNEKLVNPYIGMTANCILLEVDHSFFSLPLLSKIEKIDEILATRLSDSSEVSSPRVLNPLPLLGMPGWHPDNVNESFYDNQKYFR